MTTITNTVSVVNQKRKHAHQQRLISKHIEGDQCHDDYRNRQSDLESVSRVARRVRPGGGHLTYPSNAAQSGSESR